MRNLWVFSIGKQLFHGRPQCASAAGVDVEHRFHLRRAGGNALAQAQIVEVHDLMAQASAHVMAQVEASKSDMAAYAARYLTSRHRDNPSKGCPIAALGCETARQSTEARVALAKGIQARIEQFAESMSTAGMDDERARRAAIGGMAAMVGAMILARLTDDKAFSADLLDETRAWITDNAGGQRS